MYTQHASHADWVLGVNWVDVLFAMITGLICGAIIYLVYRYFYRGSFYNDNFNALLVMVTVITALIITTVSSNLALSLGMVGALSIVRFRAAIKDPLDVGFVFYAVAVGLTAGAGLYLIALLGTVVIALVYMGLSLIRFSKASYLVVVKYPPEIEKDVIGVLKKYKYTQKNKTHYGGDAELTLEVRQENDIEDKLRAIKKVKSVVKVEYNGDYLG
ncbi:MAG: DUF4956 domain-containing protein [Pseudomonadales bacterium]|nr:DUF4956 domain-containing protein [Pseudomonadales bacterium]